MERQVALSRQNVTNTDTERNPPHSQREGEGTCPQWREKRLPVTINCCAMLGLDDFRSIRHQHGRVAAGAALLHFSGKLLQHVRQSDALSRLGEDAFLLLLPQTRLIDAFDLIELLRRIVLASPLQCDGVQLALRFSAAVTEQAPYEHLSDTLSRATTALHSTRTETCTSAGCRTPGHAGNRTGT